MRAIVRNNYCLFTFRDAVAVELFERLIKERVTFEFNVLKTNYRFVIWNFTAADIRKVNKDCKCEFEIFVV